MAIPLSRYLEHPELLGRDFAASSWHNWKVTLKAAFGEPLSPGETETFTALAQRPPPPRRVSELWLAIGRRAGKDSVASAVATYIATQNDFTPHLRRGEKATILCLAVDRDQAKIVFNYIRAYFEQIPVLSQLLISAKDDVVSLTNNVEIVVGTNTYRGLRGKTIACVILDECAFWRDTDYRNPDVEVYAAIMPAMATLRAAGALVIGISTTHRKSGLLYDKITSHYGQDSPDVLAILAPSLTYNPALDPRIIAADLASDPERANAEWNSVWRADLSDLFDRELVIASIDKGRTVSFPRSHTHYTVFADPSGGRGDAFTAAAGHTEDARLIIDHVYVRPPPFASEAVLDEVSFFAHDYRAATIFGDAYGADIITGAFARRGIKYENLRLHGSTSPKLNRSEIYLNALPLFTAGRVRLPDNPALIHQLISLERRATSSGHDVVDHPTGKHDDVANAVCGCLVAMAGKRKLVVTEAALEASRRPAGTNYLPSYAARLAALPENHTLDARELYRWFNSSEAVFGSPNDTTYRGPLAPSLSLLERSRRAGAWTNRAILGPGSQPYTPIGQINRPRR